MSPDPDSDNSCKAFSRNSQGQMLFPDKVFLKILRQLSWSDINCCRLTCTRLYNLVSRHQISLPRRRVHLVRIVFGFFELYYDGQYHFYRCTSSTIVKLFGSCDIDTILLERTFLTKQFVQDLFDGVVSGSITVRHFDLRQCRGPDDVLIAYVQRDFKFFLR